MPVLTLLYGLPVRYAVAVSLVAVAATSASSAGSYLRQGRVDVPLALDRHDLDLDLAQRGGRLRGAHGAHAAVQRELEQRHPCQITDDVDAWDVSPEPFVHARQLFDSAAGKT